jgi:hypothetical protein
MPNRKREQPRNCIAGESPCTNAAFWSKNYVSTPTATKQRRDTAQPGKQGEGLGTDAVALAHREW